MKEEENSETRAACLHRTAQYMKKFTKHLDLVRCMATKDKIFAAVEQILKGSRALETAIKEVSAP